MSDAPPPIVLITGAAHGLGRAVAAHLAGQGHQILISARDGDAAARTADELGATYPGAEAMGARPVDESARGVVWAATLPADGPTGGFSRDARPLPW